MPSASSSSLPVFITTIILSTCCYIAITLAIAATTLVVISIVALNCCPCVSLREPSQRRKSRLGCGRMGPRRESLQG